MTIIAAIYPQPRVAPFTRIRQFLTEFLTLDPKRAEPTFIDESSLNGPLLTKGIFGDVLDDKPLDYDVWEDRNPRRTLYGLGSEVPMY